MRILYPINIDFPGFRANAIQVLNTANSLAKHGSTVYLLFRRSSLKPTRKVLAYYNLEPLPNLKIIRIPVIQMMWGGIWNKLSNLSFYPFCMVVSFFLVATGKVDVIYVRLITRRIYWFFRMLRNWFGKKLVFEAHQILFLNLQGEEVIPPVNPAKLKPAAQKAYFQEKDIYKTADGVIFISSSMMDFIQQYFDLKQLHCAIHDGTSHRPVSEPRINDNKHLLYCGHLIKNRGVDLLIEAMAQLSQDVRLTIVGGIKPGVKHADYGEEQKAIEARIRELGFKNRVQFTGFVPPSEVPSYFEKASILLMPMLRDVQTRFSSPLKLFEYMSSGKPIIASDLDSVREVLQHERNALLFRPGDVDDLVRQIKKLLGSRELQFQIARQSLSDVEQYTWKNRARRIIQFLEIIMKDNA